MTDEELQARVEQAHSPTSRIRTANFYTRTVLLTFRNLSRLATSKQEIPGRVLAHQIASCAWNTKIIAQELKGLSDLFSAAYLELCRAAQLIRAPEHWEWETESGDSPSYHVAALQWSRGRLDALADVLEVNLFWAGEDSDFPDQVADLWTSRAYDVGMWGEATGEAGCKAIPLLNLERVQAMLILERHPGIVGSGDVGPATPPSAAESALKTPNEQAVRTNNGVHFSEGWTPKPDIVDLCHRLANSKGTPQIEVAREFTGKNESRANSLLAQVRRAVRDGKVIFFSGPMADSSEHHSEQDL